MQQPITRWLSGGLLVLVLAVAGCDGTPVELSDDQSAIEALILTEVDFFTSDLFSAQGAEDPDSQVPGRILADIVPWRWGRQILDVTREIDVTIHTDDEGNPATADVTWTGQLAGLFHIIDTTGTAYSKNLAADAVRYATFERRANATAQTQHRGWRMTGISGTTVVSDPNTVEIVQVQLTSTGGVDTTFTDVSTIVDRENIIAFANRDTVTVEVTTGNSDDIVMIHYPAWAQQQGHRRHLRHRLRNNGDGTYSGQWITRGALWRNGQFRNPPRHVTIDILSHGTVFTDDEAYDSTAWGFVYRVTSDD